MDGNVVMKRLPLGQASKWDALPKTQQDCPYEDILDRQYKAPPL